MSAAEEGAAALSEAKRMLKAFDKTRFEDLRDLIDSAFQQIDDAETAFNTVVSENDDLQSQVEELNK